MPRLLHDAFCPSHEGFSCDCSPKPVMEFSDQEHAEVQYMLSQAIEALQALNRAVLYKASGELFLSAQEFKSYAYITVELAARAKDLAKHNYPHGDV